MLEGVVVDEQGLIVMHMVSCTVVLHPCAVDSSHVFICCCFETERETAEYCRVGRCIGSVSISQISSLGVVSTSMSTSPASTTSATSSPSATAAAAFVRFAGLLRIVLFSNAFVAVLFCVISETAVAARGVSVWLSG